MNLKSIDKLLCERCKKNTLCRVGIYEKEVLVGFTGKRCKCGNKQKADLKKIDYIYNKLI